MIYLTELYKSIDITVNHNKENRGDLITQSPLEEQMVEVDLSETSSESLIDEYLNRNYVFTGILPSCQKGIGILGFSKNNLLLRGISNYKTGITNKDSFIDLIFKESS